jgi:GTPase Era involved in 16S rRNA processing
VKLVGSLELTSYIKKDGRKHICFIGPTSSGKSTLVNELCGTD